MGNVCQACHEKSNQNANKGETSARWLEYRDEDMAHMFAPKYIN